MLIQDIIDSANKFLTERNWWQFHNPKNDATNILVESAELIEHFIDSQLSDKSLLGIKDEIADVLLATIVFCISNNISIKEAFERIHNKSFKQENISYKELQDLILETHSTFTSTSLNTPSQTATALLVHASKITDLFIWCSEDYSKKRAEEKRDFIITQIVYIISHLVYLAAQLNIDLPKEFMRKMQNNMKRYPVDTSTGEKYMALKDKHKEGK